MTPTNARDRRTPPRVLRHHLYVARRERTDTDQRRLRRAHLRDRLAPSGSSRSSCAEHLGGPDVEPLPVLDAVLRHAVSGDDSRRPGPLRRGHGGRAASAGVTAATRERRCRDDQCFSNCSTTPPMVCVREIRATGEVAKGQAPIDDPSWQNAAARSVDDARFGRETLKVSGISR